METLKAALNRAGIDTSTFELLTDDSGAGSIYTLQTTGADAIALWKQLRGLTEVTGYWPVLLGEVGELEEHIDSIENVDEQTMVEIIQYGTEMNLQTWLAENITEWENKVVASELIVLHGEWPKEDCANHDFLSLEIFQRKPLALGLLPVRHCWEVPAVLGLGGWNNCPFTEVHVGLMKSWQDRFGAEIVTATDDIVEMYVSRPPQTQEAALELVMEHFFYCGDSVALLSETIERLAAILLNGTVWYFWWD